MWCRLCSVDIRGGRREAGMHVRGRRHRGEHRNLVCPKFPLPEELPLLEKAKQLWDKFRLDVQDLPSQPLFESSGLNTMMLTTAQHDLDMSIQNKTVVEMLEPSWRQEYEDLIRRGALSSVLLAFAQARMEQRGGGVASLRGEFVRELVVSDMDYCRC